MDVDPPASSSSKESNKDEKRHSKKEKVADDEDVDHWKLDPFNPGDMPHPLAEESSFATLFPKYREKYLQEIWPMNEPRFRMVTMRLKEFGISCELNLFEGTMTVKTTRKTWDPYAIVKARDMIKLLSRSVPAIQALKVMQDDMTCDIIKIGGMVQNKERFVKRRQRLMGPNGATLKAIELLTNCYVLIQGNTVSAIGDFKGLKWVRKVVEDCMNNIHPIYNIKTLLIRRELAKDPALANENWDRFLPKFKKKNVKRRLTSVVRPNTSERSPFPDAPAPRKVDLELESGEYWQKESERKARKAAEKKEASELKGKENSKARRDKDTEAPVEPTKKKGYEASLESQAAAQARSTSEAFETASNLKAKIGSKSSASTSSVSSSDFVSRKRKHE